MSEPASWKDALLNDDGEDLIYEVEGDAERGNPLDIVCVATCHYAETVLGLKFPARSVAVEMKRRWNMHEDMARLLDEASGLVGADARPAAKQWLKDYEAGTNRPHAEQEVKPNE